MIEKPVEQLTATQALVELKKLSEDVEFEEAFTKDTPLEKLHALVSEGRALLKGEPQKPEEKPEEEPEPPKVTAKVKTPSKAPFLDYLRKYQYRQNTVTGSPQSDPMPGSRAEKIKKILLTQPKVRIMIPKPESEKGYFPHSVTINGYRLDLPKNVYLDVPEQVADMVLNAQKQTQEAYDNAQRAYGLDRNKEGVRVGSALGA